MSLSQVLTHTTHTMWLAGSAVFLVFVTSSAVTSSTVTSSTASTLGTPWKNNPDAWRPQTTAAPDPNKPGPSRTFPFHAVMDDHYELHWDFNASHITLEAVVQTTGWVGLGVSPNGGMAGSDVVIGWVKDGRTHFADRHADGEFLPARDVHQDWTLLGLVESGGYTRLTTVRPLESCDPQDLSVREGTTRLLYAYSRDDGADDGSVHYHGAQSRGSRSLILLDPPSADKKPASLPDDVITYDFLNDNYSVPAADTTYRCTIWKMPDLGGKHHMIRFSPVIQPGHEKLLHHMILYWCSDHIPDDMVGSEHMCYRNEPHSISSCQHVFFAWAIGGQSFDYPLVAGQSMGAPGDPGYFKLETHYDNPQYRADFVDSSGLRMFLTRQLRQHDAGFMEVGVAVDQYQQIPPGDPAFLSSGFCRSECIEQTLSGKEIKVFSSMLHSHLLGAKMRTRHFRNGTELEPIAQDNNYDFNFQEQRYLPQERTVKAGDSLTVECVYNSESRTQMTEGGLSSRQEMCLSFLVYYPAVPLTMCRSRLIYRALTQGRTPQQVLTYLHGLDWGNTTNHAMFRQWVDEAYIMNQCIAPRQPAPFNEQYTEQPVVRTALGEPDRCHV